MEEVQNREAGAANWTLKCGEPRRKSKIVKPELWIGRYSSISHGGSPKTGRPEQRIGRYSSVSHGESPKLVSRSSGMDVIAA